MNITNIQEVAKESEKVKPKQKIIINEAKLGLAAKLAQQLLFTKQFVTNDEYVEKMILETKRHYAILSKVKADLEHGETFICAECLRVTDEERRD